jgi:predicted phage tail protein
MLSPKSPTDIKTVSRLFSNYENVTLRNVAIPIGYGRLRIGSIVISNQISFNIYAGDQTTSEASLLVAKELGALPIASNP